MVFKVNLSFKTVPFGTNRPAGPKTPKYIFKPSPLLINGEGDYILYCLSTFFLKFQFQYKHYQKNHNIFYYSYESF